MKRKPLDPNLPGKYGKMTAEEMDAEVAKLDRYIPFSETRPLTPAMRRKWVRAKQGKKKK